MLERRHVVLNGLVLAVVGSVQSTAVLNVLVLTTNHCLLPFLFLSQPWPMDFSSMPVSFPKYTRRGIQHWAESLIYYSNSELVEMTHLLLEYLQHGAESLMYQLASIFHLVNTRLYKRSKKVQTS